MPRSIAALSARNGRVQLLHARSRRAAICAATSAHDSYAAISFFPTSKAVHRPMGGPEVSASGSLWNCAEVRAVPAPITFANLRALRSYKQEYSLVSNQRSSSAGHPASTVCRLT